MPLKKPLTFDEQIIQLQTHGMVIPNANQAIDVLKTINYYRFTGYAIQFRKDPHDSDFRKGITFEEIYSIYLFDTDLRDLLRKYLEIVEVYYRTQIAYNFSISNCLQPPHEQHYAPSFFENPKGHQEIINSLQRECSNRKDELFVQHHSSKYGNKMPLWVIVELLSFSNLSKLYNAMKCKEKNKISTSVRTRSNILTNHLHCLSVLRNKCAHNTRLYNSVFSPPAILGRSFLKKNPQVDNSSFFAYLLVLKKRLPNSELQAKIKNEFEALLNKYAGQIDRTLLGIPDNYLDCLKYF